MNNIAAYEPALRAGGPPQFRDRRRFSVAFLVAAWAVAGLLSTTVPDLTANRDRIILYFLFLLAAVLLLLLSVAAVDMPAADRAAARLEGWLGAML